MDKYLIIPKFSNSGGTRQYLLNLLEYLYKTEKNSVIILSKTFFDEEINSMLLKYNFKHHLIDEYPKIEAFFVKNKLKSLYQFMLNFKKFFSILYYQIKYSINKTIFSEWNLIWDFIFLFLPTKKYFVVHSYPMRKLIKPLAIFSRFMFPKKDSKIISVSKYAINRINDYWFDSKTNSFVSVIYNFSKLEQTNDKIINTQSYNNNLEITIITVAHLVDYKNPELWLKIAQELTHKNDNIKFYWIGDGELYNFYKEYESDNIKFLGNIDNLKPYYDTTDIYFQPSKIESQGLAVLETMNLGIPSIVSSEGGLKESVIDGYNGFVIDLNDSIDNICNRFEMLLSDKEFYNRFKNNCIKYYADKFSKEKWYKSMNTIINGKNKDKK
ncbi:MAG: glycosyltransferase family 4 protein [Candidatus Delongbacteria bacterium]|jgi:glycosyltransferase involved in cell wall biosynthesis|nr:glycosyltransferase family 4 protein [Candidatus Delongbacteria bacterium]